MQPIVDFFQHWLHHLPLELFVLGGTFIEELVSPIPSFLVLVPAGLAAAARDYPYWYLLVLMVFSAVGRVAGSIILYKLADKVEGAALSKRHRLFGVTHSQVEQVGRRLGEGRRRDWVTLFTLNALPIFPTPMLSVACGFLKVNFKMFVFCNFFGTMINALIFMSIGYVGVQAAETLRGITVAGRITTVLLIVAGIIWFVRYRQLQTRGKA